MASARDVLTTISRRDVLTTVSGVTAVGERHCRRSEE
jgi:hypothetical protein